MQAKKKKKKQPIEHVAFHQTVPRKSWNKTSQNFTYKIIRMINI